MRTACTSNAGNFLSLPACVRMSDTHRDHSHIYQQSKLINWILLAG